MPAFGADAKLAIGKQNSWGTSKVDSLVQFNFVSEGLSKQIEEVIDPSLTGRFDRPDRVEGISRANGPVEIVGNPLVMGHFLEGGIGPSVSSAVGSGFQHVWNPTTVHFDSDYSSMNPYTISLDPGESGVNSSYLFVDMCLNTLEVRQEAGQPMRMLTDFMGRNVTYIAKPTTTPYSGTHSPFLFSTLSLSINGAGVDRVSDLSFPMANNIAHQDRLNASLFSARIMRDGYRDMDFSATIDMKNDDWELFRALTEVPIVASWLGVTSISSGVNEVFTIDMPRAEITSYPLGVGGPGIVTVGLEAKAQFHSGSGTAVTFTLQNTVADY